MFSLLYLKQTAPNETCVETSIKETPTNHPFVKGDAQISADLYIRQIENIIEQKSILPYF